MSTNLDEMVLQLLKDRKGDWLAVAERSGVSYSWLSKFVNGHIPNPGFATLTKLHQSLTGTEGVPEVPAKAVA